MSTMPDMPKMDKITSHFDTITMRKGEVPSANGGASARGLARVVGGGELKGVRIMSDEAVAKMPTSAKDVELLGITSDMTQGGRGIRWCSTVVNTPL